MAHDHLLVAVNELGSAKEIDHVQQWIDEGKTVFLDSGVYTFVVHPDSNKTEIRQAVESIFNVRVAKVNTLNRKGKRKRNRRQASFGKRPDTKRAIVTVAPGERIDIFSSPGS